MVSDGPDVLVLRQNVHGMDPKRYVAALRERLPDREVAFAATPAEERELLKGARVVAGLTLDPSALERAENLRLFACSFAGVDHLDLDAFRERGVAVTSGSGLHGPNVAEHVVGVILAFARGLLEARRRQRRREWRAFQATELAGERVTVVGLGDIGTAVVERLDGFDVHTTGVRYTPEKGGPTDEVFGFDEVHAAIEGAAYVVLACPLTDETERLIDADALLTMSPESVLVNVARGAVVDTDALVHALRHSGIRGAGLDVTDPEPLPESHALWTLENVLLTPHTAGHSPEYFGRRADLVAQSVETAESSGEWRGLTNQVV